MSSFVKKVITNEIELYLYSERGKLDLLYFYFLNSIDNFSKLLNSCKNLNGNLSNYIKKYNSFTLFTEFDLGNEGFGSPDGCIITDNGYVIFIEGKNVSFKESFKSPEKKNINGFNSSLNGQIELRWRFINAMLNKKENKISEKYLKLPSQYKDMDVFYNNGKRRELDDKDDAKYRRLIEIDLLKDILEIFNNNISLDKVFFLIITKDNNYPSEEIEKIRLLDYNNGNTINSSKKVFYYCIDDILKLCNARYQ